MRVRTLPVNTGSTFMTFIRSFGEHARSLLISMTLALAEGRGGIFSMPRVIVDFREDCTLCVRISR